MSLEEKKEALAEKNFNIQLLIQDAEDICSDFFQFPYTYSNQKAVKALGVESELVDQLIKDYTVQILRSWLTFSNYLEDFQALEKENKTIDFRDFRNLAHKNLGAARNLRIEDSQEILSLLMESDDLEDIKKYLEVLKASAILLQPTEAQKTLLSK